MSIVIDEPATDPERPNAANGSRVLPVTGGPATLTSSAHGWTGRLASRLLGLRPGTQSNGRLTIVVDDHGERWTRQFGTATWSTTLHPGPEDRTVVERVGPVALRFGVHVDPGGDTVLELRDVRIGRLRPPLTRSFAVHGRIGGGGTTTIVIDLPGGSCRYGVEFGTRP